MVYLLSERFAKNATELKNLDLIKEKNGRIDIEVIRDGSSSLLPEDKPISDITGFIIKDNGIGFDEKNYDAFLTSDTTYKVKRGGKGIGRSIYRSMLPLRGGSQSR